MPIDKITRAALDSGRHQATRVLAVRAVSLKKREKALKTHAKKITREAKKLGVAPREVVAPLPKAVAETAGMLVAEGDSWFDYPWHDVLKLLEDDHGYDVESVACKGDPIEEMAYGGNQLGDLTRCIEKVLRRGIKPKAVLLSGGGNDIAGDEFGMLLNHARSAIAGFNLQVVAGVIDQRIRTAYVTILSAVTEICVQKTGSPVPVLVHGYDYPVPDGRGFMGGWGPLPGPWLEPGFREKGYEDLNQRIELTQTLIDRFNSMVKGVASLQPFAHVKYIDLRNTLSHGTDYKKWWANELHPTGDGFSKVTDKFAAVLGAL
jgi:GDSL-like Lipase/Acylhydrolase family